MNNNTSNVIYLLDSTNFNIVRNVIPFKFLSVVFPRFGIDITETWQQQIFLLVAICIHYFEIGYPNFII